MNEQFPNPMNPEDEKIAQRLNAVAEQTYASAQFAAQLEERLRKARRPKTGWFAAAFKQVSPALRWAFLMILLAVVLSWSIKTLIPAPQPATNNTLTPSETSTPAPDPVEPSATTSSEESGYDFRGGKLYLEAPLPDSPEQAHVYLLKKDAPATEEQARALAERFGIQGDIYTTHNYVFDTENYVISDGRQSLDMYSMRYFTYTADLSKTSRIATNTPHDNAEAIIREFLQAREFDFQYRITPTDSFGGYIVWPLAPDSIPMQYEPFTMPAMLVMLGEDGQVLRLDASLMEYDPAPLGEYRIISAQEALNKLLDDSAAAGKIESSDSPGPAFQDWFRSYPDNQPVTAYGPVVKFPALDPGRPTLILMNGVPVTGNVDGLEGLDDATYIKATGQYISEAGIRRFNIDSWDYQQEGSFSGTLSRQGERIVLTLDDGSGKQYPLIDPPSDVPLDTEVGVSQLSVYGVLVNGELDWDFIRYFENFNSSGGGGGGGGSGFHQLNLSGPPVPIPTSTPPPSPNNEPSTGSPFTGMYTVQEGDTCSAIAAEFGISLQSLIDQNRLLEDCLIFVGQKLAVPVTEQNVQDLRGYLSITIHRKTDGTSTKEYTLEAAQENGTRLYIMQGPLLSELDAYNALPILVSGTIDTLGKLTVDSYKIPYPDLQFQIIKGTQSTAQLEGQNVIVFTTEDGKSYVEFLVTNPFPLTAESLTGRLGDTLQQEVLILPDETFGGLPVAHVYQSAIVPENGPEMEVQSNTIYTINDSELPGMGEYTPPNLTITEAELTYLASNPYYQVSDPNYDQRSPYLQPVWHFHGRYDNGSEFDILIQALQQEFLLPELAPGISPG